MLNWIQLTGLGYHGFDRHISRMKYGEHENVSAEVERIFVVIHATLTCKICVNVMVYIFLFPNLFLLLP